MIVICSLIEQFMKNYEEIKKYLSRNLKSQTSLNVKENLICGGVSGSQPSRKRSLIETSKRCKGLGIKVSSYVV